MNILVHDYTLEETREPFKSLGQELVNVDYDDKTCMTLYTEQTNGQLVYVTLTEQDIKLIVEAYNNGPLA
jgi:hypothetical protein